MNSVTAASAAGFPFATAIETLILWKAPSTMSEPARKELAEDWRNAYGGFDNAGRVAVLEEGIKIQDFGFPPEDAQWLQTRGFQVLEFSRWLGLPPHKLYELSRATFSNIEQQALEYLTDSLNGWLVNWEQQMLLDLGFTWISSKYPAHLAGKPKEAPGEEVFADIVRSAGCGFSANFPGLSAGYRLKFPTRIFSASDFSAFVVVR